MYLPFQNPFCDVYGPLRESAQSQGTSSTKPNVYDIASLSHHKLTTNLVEHRWWELHEGQYS